jgi:CRISPR-associated endonuclease/helicase Cas3
MADVLPTFSEFFEAAHGYAPFPWQQRLATTVLRDGWPELLDLPTGSGKTTTLDIALYCLAMNPRSNPRRVVIVVDRRLVVDQGADHARRLLSMLMAAQSGPLHVVANALRRLWGASAASPPFAVAVLRGGMPMDNDWARRPDQPVLGVSTVDQVGSRLLFRGYGISPRSSSIHAGLMGSDTLLLLDEVHLAEPFAETLDQLRQYQNATDGLPPPIQSVRMSATPRSAEPASFSLDEADLAHPVLARRLQAQKFATLESVKVTGRDERSKCRALAAFAIDRARALMGSAGGARVVAVVVNRVYTAQCAAEMLAGDAKAPPFVLVTGRMRPLDRDRVVRDVLIPGAGAGRDRSTARPLLVIATQCIEAGADLDFDAIVTECASLDALRQRFGRVDRRGDLGQTRSVIVCRSDATADPDDPVYGGALARTWEWLTTKAAAAVLDFGINGLAGSLSDPLEVMQLLPPRHRAAVLLPAHIDMFAETTPVPFLDQDPALWLHGPEKETSDVQVVWRANVDTSADGISATIERLAVCRPSTLEAVVVPLTAVRCWLGGDGDEPPPFPDAPMHVADESHPSRERSIIAVRWRGADSEGTAARDLRPGDVVVIDCSRGGLSRDSFDPASAAHVGDLAPRAALLGRGEAALWMHQQMLESCGVPADVAASAPSPTEDETLREFRDRVDNWLSLLPDSLGPDSGWRADEWAAVRAALSGPRRRVVVVGGIAMVRAPLEPAVREGLRGEVHDDVATEAEIAEVSAGPVTLREHGQHVVDFVSKFAANLSFAPEFTSDLVTAARLHDLGKADPRFQRLLVGGSEIDAAMLEEPLAKSGLTLSPQDRSAAWRASGYPEGTRHELMSVALVKQVLPTLPDVHDPDLVLHLIASHHGWCRPFAPPADDGDPVLVEITHAGLTMSATTAHGLARLSSGVADRFWALCKRYGWWNLALLEATLRLADHRASEIEKDGCDGTA